MTQQGLQFPQFYVTAAGECPYLPEQEERKVFTELTGFDANSLNEALSRVGFRRSQGVAYRPACDNCSACISVRVITMEFKPSKSRRKVLKRNQDLQSSNQPPIVTQEQYTLLRSYLNSRHSDGSMVDMSFQEYQEMVESSAVETYLIEYRRIIDNKLYAVALTDRMSDGLSMVYSFFDSEEGSRGLGNFLILNHIQYCQENNLPYLYLGYWVEKSQKMAYKSRFGPMEMLGPEGWSVFEQSTD